MREVFSLNRECRVLHGIESAQGLKNSDRPMDIFVIVNNFASIFLDFQRYIFHKGNKLKVVLIGKYILNIIVYFKLLELTNLRITNHC